MIVNTGELTDPNNKPQCCSVTFSVLLTCNVLLEYMHL